MLEKARILAFTSQLHKNESTLKTCPNAVQIRDNKVFRENTVMDFDFRVLIVLFPILAAGGWAISRVLPVAIKQVQAFLAK
jgi:photosystem II PsbY protein